MDHKKTKELVSSYHDGELSPEDKKHVEDHIRQCEECRREFEEINRFEEVMGTMAFKNPPQEVWKVYWKSVYNRLERRIGWILLSVGGMILFFFGGYKAVEGLIKDPGLSLVMKIGILIFMAGIIVMLFSLLRERIFVRKRERYKEIEL